MAIHSSNPALSEGTFSKLRYLGDRTGSMTVQGTVYKTLMLLLLVMLSAGWTWIQFFKTGGGAVGLSSPTVSAALWIGAIGGFVMAMVTIFKKEWAPVTAPLYALLEGFFIGGISATLEVQFPGIVIQAAGLTFCTLLSMLAVYQLGWIKATENFKLGIFAATGGIALLYLVMFVLSFFGIQPSFMYGNSWISIGVSVFIVGIAALNFIIDFDMIEQGVRQNVPKYMEWYGAFAMMVTLIWLYIEFLRLLSKLRSRD